MSKPLELKTFPPLREEPNPVRDGWDAWRDWDNQIRDEYRLRAMTRFTDAELSAELFRQTAWLGANGRTHRADAGRNIVLEAAFTYGPLTRDEHEWLTLSHFTTLPHYWEVDE